MTMAFFPNLSDLKLCIITDQFCSNWKFLKINAVSKNIFPKITLDHGSTFFIEFIHNIRAQKTNLTMPFSCMGISF